MTWRTISSNPINIAVVSYLREQTKSLCRPIRSDYADYIHQNLTNKSVLDIGCVEHDRSHWESSRWKHKILSKFARRLVGVDILKDDIETLCSMGYDIRHMDATGGGYLGEVFDYVVIGDVIEHVNNPVDLLRFAARHLDSESDGAVFVMTPNPFYWRYFFRSAINGVMVENAEHVRWITPCNALEMAERSQLRLRSYRPLTSRRALFNPIYWVLRLLSRREPEVFAAQYVFEFALPPKVSI